MKEPLIAVVDDTPDLVCVMVEVLADAGYHTVTASNADETRAMLERERPGLLILDICVPGVKTGRDFLQAMRKNPAAAKIPILVCTGDVASLRENCTALRALGCETLAKPFDVDSLLGCVASLLPPRKA